MIGGRLVAPFTPQTTRGTPKVTLALNVSCHLLYVSLIHEQTYLPDPMHACLNVDEIVRLIAHELVASGGEASAVGLACCCKSFEDPALDALWATQGELLHFSRLFREIFGTKVDAL